MVKLGFPCRVIRLALDPSDPRQVYAAIEVGGVLRSGNGGDTWEGCNEGLLEFTSEPRLRSRIVSDTETGSEHDGSHALEVSPAKPGTVFLANRMGLFRSGDRGTHWQEVGIGRFSPLTYARDVKVSRHDPRTMYAALSVAAVSDEGSLYRSRDLGQTWQRFDHDVSMKSTLMIIAESPANPERVYCATRKGQVFGTEDGGKRWAEYQLPDGIEGVYRPGGGDDHSPSRVRRSAMNAAFSAELADRRRRRIQYAPDRRDVAEAISARMRLARGFGHGAQVIAGVDRGASTRRGTSGPGPSRMSLTLMPLAFGDRADEVVDDPDGRSQGKIALLHAGDIP